MQDAILYFHEQLDDIRNKGLYKSERVIDSRQGPTVRLADGRELLNMCANNYLGLSGDPALVAAARAGLERWGFGLSSVRFICGTQSIHKELEQRISRFVGQDDAILYSSCFDANTGLFETLLGEQDAVISDELNHASIIDGIRLCKARRYRYRNNDMADLRIRLNEARDAGSRICLVATDGVFSMDGSYANLPAICDLADEYGALVMVDDSHAVGFIGENGRGTPERSGVMDRIDILTGTFGKALGGGSGGYTAARQPIVELLRQRSRPYLFSNTLAPVIAAVTISVIDRLERDPGPRTRLLANTRFFRERMAASGFDILPGDHPIVPVMFYDERAAVRTAQALLDEGVYVTGFTYPVVPLGKARIRTQVSAAHAPEDLARVAELFAKAGR